MNLQANTPIGAGLRQGILMGIFGAIASIVPLAVDYQPFWFGLVTYGILIWLTSEGIKNIKKAQNGFITTSQGFKTGFWASFVAGTIMSLAMMIFRVITPDTQMAKIIEQQREALEDQDKIPQQQIDQVIGIIETMTQPVSLFFISIVFYLLFGMLVSIIIASSLKNERSPFEQD